MKPVCRRGEFVWSVSLLLITLVVGCGSDDSPSSKAVDKEDGGSCAAKLTGWTPASGWMREATDIVGYRYETAPADAEAVFELIGTKGESVGTMTVDQLNEKEDGPVGAMRAVLSGTDGTDVALTSTGRDDGRGYSIQVTLERGENRMFVWMDFSASTCPVEGAKNRPACVANVPVENTAFLAPTCGLFDEGRRLAGLHPRLQHLEYGVPADVASSVPDGSGAFRNGSVAAHTKTVVSEGEPIESSEVESWLSETGVGKWATSTDVHRLALAYLDKPWRGEVRSRLRECRTSDSEESSGEGETQSEQQTLGCRRSGLVSEDDVQTRRQPQSPCGSGGYDEGANDGSGNDFGSGDGGSCGAGCAVGDPHLTSFDGHSFDFQGAGEYVLAESTESDFAIHGRFEPRASGNGLEVCEDVTWVTAVAATFGDGTVAVYGERDPSLYVNGQPVEDPTTLSDLPDGAVVRKTGSNAVLFQWPRGSELSVGYGGGTLDVDVDLARHRRGDIRGLLGTFNGDRSDDFVTSSGRTIEIPLRFEERYDIFGESWRLSGTRTLFTYESGNDASSFYRPAIPEGPADLEKLPEKARTSALETCRERDVSEGTPLRWCVLDEVCWNGAGPSGEHEDLSEPAGTSHADVTTSGDVQLGVERPDVAKTEAQSPAGACEEETSAISLVRERKGVGVNASFSVDARAGTTVEEGVELESSELSPDDPVDSYLLHLRPIDAEAVVLEGAVSFPSEVLGVAVRGSTLGATDGTFGLQDATYPKNAGDRGADLGAGDRVVVGENRVELRLDARQSLDQIRIFVRGSNP